jgi:hypothetical protein
MRENTTKALKKPIAKFLALTQFPPQQEATERWPSAAARDQHSSLKE